MRTAPIPCLLTLAGAVVCTLAQAQRVDGPPVNPAPASRTLAARTATVAATPANSFTAPRDFLPYSRSVADGGQYFVHQATVFPFEAGETPLVYAYADTQPIQDLTCTATGREVVLP